jgi:4-hydroxybenzoate polyprenyltransferase
MIMQYIRQLRLKNWLKNVFVFLPIVFSQQLTVLPKLWQTVAVFSAFCLVSSAVYTFNDLFDVENDRLHPVKQKRPIASGAIAVHSAVAMTIVLLALSLALATVASPLAAGVIGLYITVNVAYTMIMKHKPIFDVFCIAAGFILRVYAGGFASDETVSDWLFLTVVAMSLFMAFGKRRGEMIHITAEHQRAVLERYDLSFLNGMMFCSAGLSIVFYSLWAMNRGMGMIYTVPIIIFIVCKYLLLVYSDKSQGDPTTVILSNRILVLACLLYAGLTVLLLYAGILT